jgi:hypothetical protein
MLEKVRLTRHAPVTRREALVMAFAAIAAAALVTALGFFVYDLWVSVFGNGPGLFR